MSITTNEINQITESRKTIAAFLIGLSVGGGICFVSMNRYLTEYPKALEEKIKTLETEMVNYKNSAYTVNEITKHFVDKKSYNECIQANKRFADANKNLHEQIDKDNIIAKAYNDCKNDRIIWQNKLKQINEELDQGYGRYSSYKSLSDYDIQQRENQRNQYISLLTNTNCYTLSDSEKGK